MAYKVVKNEEKDQFWFVEEKDGEANGPAIAYYKNSQEKRIGILEDSYFILNLCIYDDEGKDYSFSTHVDKYAKNGPCLMVKNGVAYFGKFTSYRGFEGTVYAFQKGKKVKIQEYFNGFLEKEGEYNYVFEDDLFLHIPFNFSEDEKISTREFTGLEGNITYMYQTGEKNVNKVTLCAIKSNETGHTIGSFKENGFHGLIMKSIDNGELVIFRNYINGIRSDDYQLTYSKKVDGISFVVKNKDETYTDFVFSLRDDHYKMAVAKLNKNRKATSGFEILPSSIKEIKEKPLLRTQDQKENQEKKLEQLIGLQKVKKQLQRMKAYFIKNKGKDNLNLNMVFTGNPGTGKTEVARLIAGILHDIGILPTNNFVEVDRGGLVAEYIGQTEAKVNAVLSEAMGGVLFIDEAYSLYADSERDYGQKVVDILNKAIEDNRGKICVIFAGYKEPMQKMISMNKGFRSRINRHIDFPDYSIDELKEIAKLMLKKSHYKMTEAALQEIIKIVNCKIEKKDFSNAREIRNILESLYEIQAERTINNVNDVKIIKEDVLCYERENNIHIKDKKITREWLIDSFNIEMNGEQNLKNPPIVNNEYMEDRTVAIKTDKGEGTGFFVYGTGIIATCAHVIEDAENITVTVTIFTRKGGKITKSYEAETIDKDDINDVALIGIVKRELGYEEFPLMKQDYLPNCGDDVLMAGYPFGKERLSQMSFNEGKVQSINKDNCMPENEKDVERIYLDLSGQPGNSGSPVVDKKTGSVIGIFAGASLARKGYLVNEINYAIPLKYLWNLIYKNKLN